MIELLTPDEMGRADAMTIATGVSGIELMERAGSAVATVLARRPAGTRFLVLCGRGNNGGDGFVVARRLSERGDRVRLALVGGIAALRGDAALAATRWHGPVEDAAAVAIDPSETIVDALLGAGLDRDVEGPLADLIGRINASPAAVVAVDLPSGIDGKTGQVRGHAVQAVETVTFFRRKPGHVLMPGRAHCGAVHLADIGIDDAVIARIAPKTLVNSPLLWGSAMPGLDPAGHKYRRGHALVVSAGIEATGAARLAARAALRVGAGLVTLATPGSALLVNAAACEAVMVRRSDGAEGLAALLRDRRRNAVVIGPGLDPDEATRAMVEAAILSTTLIIMDAGSLTAYEGRIDRLSNSVERSGSTLVVTPHDGEFARMFPDLAGLPDKPERARKAASRLGGTVLLKGPDTVVASPDGRAAIAENATADLSTAGSGDVLSGLVGGLLAQGMPAFEAACAAAWIHGEAGRQFGRGLIAEDLPDLVPAVLRRIGR